MPLTPPTNYVIPVDEWNALDALVTHEIESRAKAQDQLSEMTIAFNQAVKERDTAIAGEAAERLTRQKTQQALTASVDREKALQREVSDLTDQLIEARKPPTVGDVWPDEPAFSPVGLSAFTVEKGQEAPSETQYDNVRAALAWAKDKGLTLKAWRGFLNKDEVKAHRNPPVENDLGNLITFGRALHLSFIADTVDRILKTTPKDTDLKIYLEGLEALKARALVFNDADQYSLVDLKAMIARVRLFSKLPIIVSLRASADIALYRALGVIVEIQTFGTLAELKTFLGKGADILCLEARKPVTADQLKAIYDTVLAAKTKPKAFFFYADKAIDWTAMPAAEVAILKSFIDRWRLL